MEWSSLRTVYLRHRIGTSDGKSHNSTEGEPPLHLATWASHLEVVPLPFASSIGGAPGETPQRPGRSGELTVIGIANPAAEQLGTMQRCRAYQAFSINVIKRLSTSQLAAFHQLRDRYNRQKKQLFWVEFHIAGVRISCLDALNTCSSLIILCHGDF